MRSVVLAGLRAHLLRLVLTGLVVVLSVGFTAATLILTDSLDAGSRRELAAGADGVDLAVLAPSDGALPQNEVAAIGAVDGVTAAAPRREATVHTVDADGRIDPFGYARVLAPPLDSAVDGDGVQLDRRSAERLGLGVGDEITVAAEGSAELVALPIAALAEPTSDAGDDPEIVAGWDVVRRFADPAGATRVDLRLAGGADAGAVVAALTAAAPDGAEVLTGDQLAQRLVDGSSQREALRIPLLVLGAVSLIVAAFVIANTFRILVAQRTRELALLRTVGATRRQVLRGVLAESAAVGLAGSLAGVAAGALTALAVGSVLDASLVLTITGTTVAWSVVIGVLMTVGSALLPARSATRVSPLAALQAVPDGADGRTAGRARLVLGVLAMVAGALLQAGGAAAGTSGGGIGLVIVVFGAAVCFLGLLILGSKVVPPLVRVLGAIAARLSGGSRSTAELATANAVRNPRRVAATTAALLIGVTTVAGFLTVVESSRSSVSVVVDGRVPADFAVHTATSEPIPDAVARAIEELPEIGSVVIDGGDVLAVNAADGVDGDDARAAIVAATADHPELSVQSFAQRRADFERDLNEAVNVILAILALALVIAFIGIANTLSLSVHERTREIGLLRALGLTRRQTRVMLGVEAALMGAVAAVVGSAAGALFAWAAVTSVAELEFVVPWEQLAISAAVATVLGVVASIAPGHRAARTSPVVALAAD
ncbi:FtsX-like permease family protein [Jiangella mangrovi]|uniref:Putative ABC transport system permease protein n=1 Tax=Jiangella mangrovi TaxID=1524084 RepID=A0A7W9LK33_9ACTN|nr:FtsX-like permease family protein [Jiangella mangrovi]MBB5786673.1 putative ABC transport system permease protein [Jiangella mangrovi]